MGLLLIVLSAGASGAARAAGAERLALRHVPLDLPGAPAAVIPADVNGDGLPDLVLVLAYTEYQSVSFDRIEGIVQVTEVVPALFDRREIRVWLAEEGGGYRPAGGPLVLPISVHSVEAGPPGIPAIAVTDEGLSALRFAGPAGAGALILEPLVEAPTILAGAQTLLPGLGIVRDLDGDRSPDVLLPARDGLRVHIADGLGVAAAPVARLVLPGDESGVGATVWRRYPMPRVEDVDGDALPDLLLDHPGDGSVTVLRGAGGGRFEPPREVRTACLERPSGDREDPDLVWFGDLDGDGRAEAVTLLEMDGDDDGLKEVKVPHHLLRFHRMRADLTLESRPYQELAVIGYPFGGSWPDITEAQFRDLDGDGRKDLVTITLDFSIFQAVSVLMTNRIGIGLRFHVWAQGADGRFTEVPDLDLEEKLLLDLGNLKLGRLGQFNGDFDGDGRVDFVHLGRGREVTVHRGGPGCRYARKPDLAVTLEEEPRDVGLVRVADLDGDGKADLAVTRPMPSREEGPASPIRIDLYLSRGAR